MALNLKEVRKGFLGLKDWTKLNIEKVPDFDKGAIKAFFKGRWDKLSALFNWRPYWGFHQSTVIVHFHGPPPLKFDPLTLRTRFDGGVLKQLDDANPNAYKHYLAN